MRNKVVVAALAVLAACSEAPTVQPTGGSEEAVVEAKPIAVKETGKAGGVDITITAVKVAGQLGPEGVVVKAEAGETFVSVTYTVKNTSTKNMTLMERPTLMLKDASGNSYATDDMAAAMASITSSLDSGTSMDLNPGTSAKLSTAWKVAKKGFDKATWIVVTDTDPSLTFALN